MSDTIARRLTAIKDTILGTPPSTSIPFDPDALSFPTFHNLPRLPGAPDHAAWVWGPQVRTLIQQCQP